MEAAFAALVFVGALGVFVVGHQYETECGYYQHLFRHDALRRLVKG